MAEHAVQFHVTAALMFDDWSNEQTRVDVGWRMPSRRICILPRHTFGVSALLIRF